MKKYKGQKQNNKKQNKRAQNSEFKNKNNTTRTVRLYTIHGNSKALDLTIIIIIICKTQQNRPWHNATNDTALATRSTSWLCTPGSATV